MATKKNGSRKKSGGIAGKGVLYHGVALDEILVDFEKNARKRTDHGYDRVTEKGRELSDAEGRTTVADLAASIASVGQLSPLVCRGSSDGPDGPEGPYELIAGFRRFEALQALGLDADILVFPEGMTDLQIREVNLLENIQREDLNSAEMADALFAYQQESGISDRAVAKAFGISAGYCNLLLKIRRESPGSVWAQWAKNPALVPLQEMRKILSFKEEQEQIDQFEIAIGKKAAKAAKNPEDPESESDSESERPTKKNRPSARAMALLLSEIEYLASPKGAADRPKGLTVDVLRGMLLVARYAMDDTVSPPVPYRQAQKEPGKSPGRKGRKGRKAAESADELAILSDAIEA